ncbi:hypothetical protein [Streptomyces sp. SID13031]|nr:hypothetical protein [Streptomyces sp. SID13031]NEA33391.1 hypothetical protein [Streptomyces sp. SID13031]
MLKDQAAEEHRDQRRFLEGLVEEADDALLALPELDPKSRYDDGVLPP